MNRMHHRALIFYGISIAAILCFTPIASLAVERTYDCAAQENRDKPTTIEILLAGKWKNRTKEVKQSFTTVDESLKVRIKFFPFLDPPLNIGIGRCVSAEEARLAIREAIRHNGGVDRLIMQDIMPHHWIKIGTTDTSELTWIPIQPEELARLTDPALTTEQFHDLYRELARQKEKKLPFGMGNPEREQTQ
ncbi:hypothetical protein [Candidatus Manganitrophus noduliformans]|uniref:Uncharacterized protein n=1 Tax=Candidatus Manganitrophus noduliformans TaxID=2606439 RepID=A0A7X6DN78_9BACT|nr:hypothetical protein [Candidatus Manganitrophus noduliformans]NKE70023.1 hypothetical protein [Candidatus Manganitrophus noduliformans]